MPRARAPSRDPAAASSISRDEKKDPGSRRATTADVVLRRALGMSAFVLAALAAWISLVPFDFRAVPIAVVPTRVVGLGQPYPGHLSRPDLVANGFYFAAIAFCGVGSLGLAERRWFVACAKVAAVVAAAIALGVLLEFGQAFLPDRTASLADVGAQSTGVIAGAIAWFLAGAPLTRELRRRLKQGEPASLLTHMLVVYCCGLVLSRLYPFDFTVDLGQLSAKLHRGSIALVPFSSWPSGFAAFTSHAVLSVVACLPVGALAASLLWRLVRTRSVFVAGIGACATLAVLEALQAVTMSRYADPGDVVTGAVGGFVGAAILYRFLRLPSDATSLKPASLLAWIPVAAWTTVLAVRWWSPMDFTLDRDVVREHLHRLTFVPFLAYYHGTYDNVLRDVVEKCVIAGVFGVLVGFAIRRSSPGLRARPYAVLVLFIALVVFGSLEAMQLFLPTRVPDATDVVVATAAAWASAWIAQHFQNGAHQDADARA